MRLAVDATAIGSGLGGDETLVASQLRGLGALGGPGDELRVLAAHGAALPVELERSSARLLVDRVRRRGGAAHFGRVLPRWLAGLAPTPDVVLTNTHAPLRSPVPVVLTVPDLSFHHHPEHYPVLTRRRLATLVPRQAAAAAAVLTISEFCRDDLIRTYGLEPARVHVVPLTVDPPTEPHPAVRDAVRRDLAARGVPGPFLLYLGNLHPRKNVARTIRAHTMAARSDPALARLPLVVAGGRWFRGSEEERAAAAAPPGSVVFLGRVDDPTREVLLRDATALVYASLFEGFGLPPLEAMARATPVIASAVTAVPEVCGDAALLVDPTDPVDIAAAMRAVVLEAEVRDRLARLGRRRAAAFTVGATAAALDRALGHVAVGSR